MNRLPSTKTAAVPFTDGLFSVCPGADVSDALEHASNILGCMHELTITVSESERPGVEVFAIQYLNEMAKALVDSAVQGMLARGRGR
ncbi:DUF3077 domain-containing protein [Pseudomonas aeruginosa]|uniref:DUF3077 domain-containing protein n=2 Tax=Pseudomonas aeruginosa TaxID=287 RepID=UPI0018A34BC6|nr:DUF3077 domain-containing protein [Pseudomonas aeruginosa]MCO2639721.1 DUF3077 domain-containing protein [Pseudomonas aeruginosa]MCO2679374.1 DUF3077 domain-containing protein [Pseudomonas aeruginosa]MDV2654563.1 DUF3077 domain-containing protein [Pseudomonas aeruginosa]QOQ64325.1 DUF3077 domain-containing protein [Pseudomonas aeruginosa]